MTTAGELMDQLEEILAGAAAQRTRRNDVVLWLRGRAEVPSLGVTASATRTGADGETEYGFTLAQTAQMRSRLRRAFTDEARAAGAAPRRWWRRLWFRASQ